jgi:hypothetical protein
VFAELGVFEQYFCLAVGTTVHGILPVDVRGLFSVIIGFAADFFKCHTLLRRLDLGKAARNKNLTPVGGKCYTGSLLLGNDLTDFSGLSGGG